MIDPKTLDLKPLSSQVAGHAASVYTTSDDLYVVKKSLEKEINFYNQIKSDPTCIPQNLSKYLPNYLGQTTIPSTNPESSDPEDAIVIENLTGSKKFAKANTLDVKLGTQLWDEDEATEEKRIRMDKVSRETTSGETGIRLTGWQSHSTSSPSTIISTPKSFGKSIPSSNLSTGLRLFFCVPNENDPQIRSEVLRKAEAKSSKTDSSESNPVLESLETETSNPPILPSKYIKSLLKHGLLPALIEIKQVFEEVECRIRGGSLLIVFEGDEAILEKELKSLFDSLEVESSSQSVKGLNIGRDPGEESLKDQEDGRLRKLIDVRIIDFAHFRFCKGEGIDEGVLKGVNSMIALIEGIMGGLK